MKNNWLIFLLILNSFVYSQENTVYTTIDKLSNSKDTINRRTRPILPVFKQFEINTSLIVNDNDDNPYTQDDESKPRFAPNGFGFKYGIGLQKNKWLGISMHTGIDWKTNEKLVAVPVYGNLRFSPFFNDDVTRLVLNLGYGRGYALGRGNLQGSYRKINLCLEAEEDIGIMAEIAAYKFNYNYQPYTMLFNIGFYIRDF